jgi:hypothetical protein
MEDLDPLFDEMFSTSDTPAKLDFKPQPRPTYQLVEETEVEDYFVQLGEVGKLRAHGCDEPDPVIPTQVPDIGGQRFSKRAPNVEKNRLGWTIERDASGQIVRAFALGVTIPQ